MSTVPRTASACNGLQEQPECRVTKGFLALHPPTQGPLFDVTPCASELGGICIALLSCLPFSFKEFTSGLEKHDESQP